MAAIGGRFTSENELFYLVKISHQLNYKVNYKTQKVSVYAGFRLKLAFSGRRGRKFESCHPDQKILF